MNKLLLTFLVPLFSLGQSDLNSMYIGDLLPDAPKLAARGNFKVGVKTIQVVNPNQMDILSSNEEKMILYESELLIQPRLLKRYMGLVHLAHLSLYTPKPTQRYRSICHL